MECQLCYYETSKLYLTRVRLNNYKICKDCINELVSIYEIEPV